VIPANIDHGALLADLNRWGIVDFKIEMICGLSRGYVSQLKKRPDTSMTYQLAARLYNFWFDERELQERRQEVVQAAPRSCYIQTLLPTT
jgi:hypothetical protein